MLRRNSATPRLLLIHKDCLKVASLISNVLRIYEIYLSNNERFFTKHILMFRNLIFDFSDKIFVIYLKRKLNRAANSRTDLGQSASMTKVWKARLYVYFATQCLMGGWWNHYSFRCQPVDYSDSSTAIRVSPVNMSKLPPTEVGPLNETTISLPPPLSLSISTTTETTPDKSTFKKIYCYIYKRGILTQYRYC